jgi:peptide/nickel transport system ATP-binding protein
VPGCKEAIPPLIDIRQDRQARCIRVQPDAPLARVA